MIIEVNHVIFKSDFGHTIPDILFLSLDVPYEEWSKEFKERLFQMASLIYFPLTEKLIDIKSNLVCQAKAFCSPKGQWYMKNTSSWPDKLSEDLFRSIVNKEVEAYLKNPY